MGFRGWPAEGLEFYEGLEADNSKTYWTAHKDVYEDKVRTPMLALLAELEPEFGGGKIFRPYRDVRFSADKTPYKTAIGATLHGGGYVQLSAKGLFAGAGMYMMDGPQLAAYRQAVDDQLAGKELERIVTALTRTGATVGGHEELKTVPRGYPRDHPRADLLRHKGIVAWREWEPGAWLGRATARTRVVDFLRSTRPLTAWLAAHVGPS